MENKTYEHESLITVLEEWQVLEFDKPDGDVVLIDEETSEEHERNDEDGSQGNSQLFVWEDCTNDKCIGSSSTIQ